MQRYFVYFKYDGTAYHGWQVQPNAVSVQEKLQDALSTLLREEIQVVGAGRTDTGVHARMMVAHFDTDKDIDGPQLVYKLNRLLPRDISADKVIPVSQDMHAQQYFTYISYIHSAVCGSVGYHGIFRTGACLLYRNISTCFSCYKY